MEVAVLQADQIKKIHNYLQTQYVHYLDVQFELVDHIASRIESRIVEEGLTFDEVYRLEIEKWTWAELENIIKSKRKHLNYFWKKRMYTYLLSFLTFPKVVTIAVSYAILVTFILTFVPMEIFETSSLVFLGGIFMISFGVSGYYSYLSQNYQEQFLAEESYAKGMSGIYSLLFSSYFILDWLHISEFTFYNKVFFLCGFIVFSIALLYTTWFVFPKWLRKDVVEKYVHLSISN